MSVHYHFMRDVPSAYFEDCDKHFQIGAYCYDDSTQEMDNNPNKIRLSFDQADEQGNVLKDGCTFEMELDIIEWQDVAEMKAVYYEIIAEFIGQLGEAEKGWFTALYKNARNKVAARQFK
jgi:hypothetical protein